MEKAQKTGVDLGVLRFEEQKRKIKQQEGVLKRPSALKEHRTLMEELAGGGKLWTPEERDDTALDDGMRSMVAADVTGIIQCSMPKDAVARTKKGTGKEFIVSEVERVLDDLDPRVGEGRRGGKDKGRVHSRGSEGFGGFEPDSFSGDVVQEGGGGQLRRRSFLGRGLLLQPMQSC